MAFQRDAATIANARKPNFHKHKHAHRQNKFSLYRLVFTLHFFSIAAGDVKSASKYQKIDRSRKNIYAWWFL